MEGKEDHSESESDSEFDNLFNRLRKVAHPESDNAGKFNNSYKLKKWQKVLFLLFYGKIGKGIDEQLDENIKKLINATRTEYRGDIAGMISNTFNF